MFKKKEKIETKQYNVSLEDVGEIAKLAQGHWMMQKIYQYAANGFNLDIVKLQKLIVAKLSIDETKYDIDWATLFKDNKIFTHPKKEEKKDGESVLPAGGKPGKKD